VASDCINAVRSMKGTAMESYGHIVNEIKARMINFLKVEFIHENRGSNTDAHHLAKSSLYLSLGRHVWYIDPPLGFCNLLFVSE